MKKYFIKETDEVLEYGDVIQLSLEKDTEDGCIICEKEIKFVEGMEDFLIDLGVIEEREVEDELIDFEDPDCELIQDLVEDFEVLEERVDRMEEMIKEIYDLLVNSLKEDKKKKSSNKKAK